MLCTERTPVLECVFPKRQFPAVRAACSSARRKCIVAVRRRSARLENATGIPDHRANWCSGSTAQVLVGPMGSDERREAVVRPAVAVDSALVSRLVAEAAGRPAAVPHVAETWLRRSGMRLMLEAP
ncbi:nSTAND1 domain-containing NTPase [Amycolatopsis kentuckyensis]|uniref:nSTAND1 domain-containing NTPase n=1 Tax=Amycolatopsis kentuckyensis TaxID=218823 RepID=UPI0031343018